jgi:hypothetical protein
MKTIIIESNDVSRAGKEVTSLFFANRSLHKIYRRVSRRYSCLYSDGVATHDLSKRYDELRQICAAFVLDTRTNFDALIAQAVRIKYAIV